MCKPHWRAYTNALRKAAVARKAEETTDAPAPELEPEVIEAPHEAPEAEAPALRRGRREKAKAEPQEEATAA
jgi:hypothetical protein